MTDEPAKGERGWLDAASVKAFVALGVFVLLVGTIYVVTGDGFYLWARAFHAIAFIAWMAGLVYLPRLFVYHADAEIGGVQSETFKLMEQRLLRVIMTPAMIITWGFGLYLAFSTGAWSLGWFHVKLVAVIALSAIHFYLAVSTKRFAADANQRPARHWRIVNEGPTLLMILIVVMAVVKPF